MRTDLLKLHELAMAVVNNGARSQASKMFDLAMNLDDQVSHMMNELEKVQDTLAKLVAFGDMTACFYPPFARGKGSKAADPPGWLDPTAPVGSMTTI